MRIYNLYLLSLAALVGVVIIYLSFLINRNESDYIETKIAVKPSVAFNGIVARAFERWKHPLPCYPAEKNWFAASVIRTPSKVGFLMNKLIKVGGSTTAGVNLRIAKNVAERLQAADDNYVDFRVPPSHPNAMVRRPFHLCKCRFDHDSARSFQYDLRSRNESFLWSVLREPTSRWVSQFFHFEVSRNNVIPNDANFISFLRSAPNRNDYYLNDLCSKRYKRGNTTTKNQRAIRMANDILADFDFLGITERMDESLVALQMILGLPTSDILYISSKRSGGYDGGGFKNTCIYVFKSFISPGMKEWFQGPEFQELVKWDTLLYQAVNRSLDLTIGHLGRDAFEENLRRFQEGQRLVAEHCADVTLRCTPAGTLNPTNNTCIWWDSGCGSDCIDRVAAEFHLGS